ncbi:hypothetical protein ABMA58_00075 [Oceanospirillum sp. HFRX-1_2]
MGKLEKALVGDETQGYPVPVRSVLNYQVRGGLDVEQVSREVLAGWQRHPGTQRWHYLQAGVGRSVCGCWHRSQSQALVNKRPVQGVCEMCLDVINRI